MPSKTLRQAEKKALDGANESQDTLVLAHNLMVGFGVGLVSIYGYGCSVGLRVYFSFEFETNPNLFLSQLTVEAHCAEKQLATSRRTDAPTFTQAKQQATKRQSQQE